MCHRTALDTAYTALVGITSGTAFRCHGLEALSELLVVIKRRFELLLGNFERAV